MLPDAPLMRCAAVGNDNCKMFSFSLFVIESLLTRDRNFFLETLPLQFKNNFKLIEKPLRDAGFVFANPEGSYYVFASYRNIPILGKLFLKYRETI